MNLGRTVDEPGCEETTMKWQKSSLILYQIIWYQIELKLRLLLLLLNRTLIYIYIHYIILYDY